MGILHYSPPDVNLCAVTDLSPTAKLIGYCRVSKPEQLHALPHQIEHLEFGVCYELGWMAGVMPTSENMVDIVGEVHTGTTFDRPVFQEVVERARREGLVVCAQDINRLVRHRGYPRVQKPTKTQLRQLLSFGVTFALLNPLSLSPGELRSLETKRGMSYSDRNPGRPPANVDEDLRRRILYLWAVEGMTVRPIASRIGIGKSTVQRIIDSF